MRSLLSSGFSCTDVASHFFLCLELISHGRHMTVSLLVLVQAGTCELSKDRWSKISLWLLRLKIRYEAPWRIGMSFVMKKYKRFPLCRKKWIRASENWTCRKHKETHFWHTRVSRANFLRSGNIFACPVIFLTFGCKHLRASYLSRKHI